MSLETSLGKPFRKVADAYMPPRSRLFHLPPIGAGTPHVECLSGYIGRLAEKHTTTPHYLMRYEIEPLLGKPGTINERATFASFSKALNGPGVIASDIIAVLERLTCRRDLGCTAMVTWVDVISSRNLIRRNRAWCPDCYKEDAEGKSDVYDRLAWAVQSVAVCVMHKRRLVTECIRCGRAQHHLAARSRPGHCHACLGWLGHDPDAEPPGGGVDPYDVTQSELHAAEEVGSLLACASGSPSAEFKANLMNNLRQSLGRWRGMGGAPRHRLAMCVATLRLWISGRQKPSLPLLLSVAVEIGTSLDALLRDRKEDRVAFESESVRASLHASLDTEDGAKRKRINWKNAEARALVEQRLLSALDEHPPRPFTELATQIHCCPGTLRYQFPELSARIAKRSMDYYRPAINVEDLRRLLLEASQESPPPSLATVCRRMNPGRSEATILRLFPQEARAITKRFIAQCKRPLDKTLIERKLREALNTEPPPSVKQVAQKLGVATAHMRTKFRDLCMAVSSRFRAHKSDTTARNRDSIKAQVRAVCEQAIAAGVYPSLKFVEGQVTAPCYHYFVSLARREVLSELNYIRSRPVADRDVTK